MKSMKKAVCFAAGAASLLALAVTGPTALAADATTANMDTNAAVSLKVNAFVGTVATGGSTGSSADSTTGKTPIQGVEYTAKEVCYNGAAIDLTTPAGWTTIKGKSSVSSLNISDTDTTGFYYCANGTHTGTTGADGTATISGATKKTLYVVSATKTPSTPTITKSVQPFLVTLPLVNTGSNAATSPWIYDVVVNPKFETGTAPTKTVSNNTADVASANDTVQYTLSASVPPATDGRKLTGLRFEDTIPAGLTDVAVASVTLNGTALTENTDYTVTAPAAANNNKLTVTLSAAKVAAAQPGNQLVVTITAKISAATSNNIENTFNFVVSDAKTDGTDPKDNDNTPGDNDHPTTQYGTFQLFKYAMTGTTQKPLQNAKFKVCAANAANNACEGAYLQEKNTAGTLQDAVFTSDAAGHVVGTVKIYEGAVASAPSAGKNFCLVETEAPAGYDLNATAQCFTLTTANTAAAPQTVAIGKTDANSLALENRADTLKGIIDALPSTGAAGMAALTLGGVVLLALGFGITVLVRRRQTEEK